MPETVHRLVGALLLCAAAVGIGGPVDGSPAAPVERTAASDLGGAARPHPAGATLVFDERFDGTALNLGRWNRCHWWAPDGCTIASNHELEWYLPGNVSVADGHLRLEARHGDVSSPAGDTYPYSSGMVSTGPPDNERPARFSFTYGYVEARLRLPEGTGLWPAFWLLPTTRQSLPEIDVLETLGHEPDVARLHVHFRDGRHRPQSLGAHFVDPALADGQWHRYGIDWRPGELTFIIDGRARWRVTGNGVPSKPMYLLLNLAVGGDYPGPPDGATVFPAAVEADRIRVWQRPSP